jgi:DNA-binding PadR family transcriptional regulator
VAASPAGPPRRYYQLTETGQLRLKEMATHWIGVRDAVDHLLNNGGNHEPSGNEFSPSPA